MEKIYFVETFRPSVRSPGGAADNSPGQGCEADAARGNRREQFTFSSFATVKGEGRESKIEVRHDLFNKTPNFTPYVILP